MVPGTAVVGVDRPIDGVVGVDWPIDGVVGVDRPIDETAIPLKMDGLSIP